MMPMSSSGLRKTDDDESRLSHIRVTLVVSMFEATDVIVKPPNTQSLCNRRGRVVRLEGRVRDLPGGAEHRRHHRAPALPLRLPQGVSTFTLCASACALLYLNVTRATSKRKSLI